MYRAFLSESYPFDDARHVFLPILLTGSLRNEDEVGTRSNACHEGQPAAVTAHDLDNEGTRVGGGGSLNVVDHLADTGEGRVAANGRVSAGKVVVDGSDEADDVEVLVGSDLITAQVARADKLLEEARPFGSELVGTSEGSVSSADDEGIDAVKDHVLCGRETTSALEEGLAASSADEGTALGQPASHVVPAHLLDEAAALNQTFVALVHTVRIAAHVDSHANNGTDNGVHAWGVTPRGHDGDLLLGRHVG